MGEFAISIFDFFLPRFCAGCKQKLTTEEIVICNNCLKSIQTADEDRLKSENQRKFPGDNIISGFLSLFVFEKDKELQNVIHAMKYNSRFLVGKYLGSLIGERLSLKINKWEIDFIVPIPLHHLKKADRGYNQSYYIAKGIGGSLKIPVNTKIIKRTRFTQSQTTMNLKEREENVSEAFKIKRAKNISGKNILLVDDVITTGATTKACAKVIIDAGANKVYAVSIAIAG